MTYTRFIHSKLWAGAVRLVALALLLPLLGACVSADDYDDTPSGNLEALWKALDSHYCFFGYKQIDWNAVYAKYQPMMNAGMTEEQEFEVMTAMLSELRDGHVNLYATFDVGRYWSWHEAYPSNVADTLLRRYLGTNYRIASGMSYRVLDDNIGYVRCATFNQPMSSSGISDMLAWLAPCRGLIIDIRGNGGGTLTSAEELAAHFCNTKTLVGYMQHKRGPGHDDFSSMEAQYLKPSDGVRWQKNVVVLTNREVFSAANEFVKYMKCMPRVKVVGDQTGGGAGLPFSTELPNGWSVRFSACPMYDANKQCTEFGIRPDYSLELSEADVRRGIDTLIEYARRLLAAYSEPKG